MKTNHSELKKATNKAHSQQDHYVRLKNKTLLPFLFLFTLFFLTNTTFAQDTESTTDNFDINLNVKNMHLWHGSLVTPGIMMATSMEYKSDNEKFVLGLWGGASTDGEYKEFSYYTAYNFTNNFNVSLISHNNYSNAEEVNIFSYDKYTSPNFIDVVFTYTVSEKVPLTLYWSTILFGNGGDYETDDEGSATDSYSTYTEVRYQLFPNKKTNLTLFAGGAFSFITEKTFYSENTNLTNLGLCLSREVDILSRKIPVAATAFWNPETKIGALQLDIKLF